MKSFGGTPAWGTWRRASRRGYNHNETRSKELLRACRKRAKTAGRQALKQEIREELQNI